MTATLEFALAAVEHKTTVYYRLNPPSLKERQTENSREVRGPRDHTEESANSAMTAVQNIGRYGRLKQKPWGRPFQITLAAVFAHLHRRCPAH